jgi:uncharacterized protein YbjT (DUF2867 family)
VKPVFITGATGYLGRPLAEVLLEMGRGVHALARSGSEHKLPPGVIPVIGDALDEATFTERIPPGATVVHLVGTPHPNPSKAAQFKSVDLASITASVRAARWAGVEHLVYVSVAQPAPLMRAYIAARQQGEALVRASGLRATILRPWYVLGPGHWWPYALVPMYTVLRWLPATRSGAERLGLVTRRDMLAALVRAVASPPSELVRIVEVPQIRGKAGKSEDLRI